MKDYNKSKESSNLKYWDLKNLYGWAMPQKLPINGLKLIKNTSEFDESFIKRHNEESDEGYFSEGDIQYVGNLHSLHNELPVLLERMKIERL